MSGLVKFDALLRRAIDGAAAILLLCVTMLGIAQVVARYGFNESLVWSEETIRLLYIWLVLIAAATAPHMQITLIQNIAHGRVLVALKCMQTLVMLGLLALLVWGAVGLNAAFGQDRYVTIDLAKSWYWTGAIVGGLLWAGSILSSLAASLARHRSG